MGWSLGTVDVLSLIAAQPLASVCVTHNVTLGSLSFEWRVLVLGCLANKQKDCGLALNHLFARFVHITGTNFRIMSDTSKNLQDKWKSRSFNFPSQRWQFYFWYLVKSMRGLYSVNTESVWTVPWTSSCRLTPDLLLCSLDIFLCLHGASFWPCCCLLCGQGQLWKRELSLVPIFSKASCKPEGCGSQWPERRGLM